MTPRVRWAWRLACHVAAERSGPGQHPVTLADVAAELTDLGCTDAEAEMVSRWLAEAGPFAPSGAWNDAPAVTVYPGFDGYLEHPGPPPT